MKRLLTQAHSSNRPSGPRASTFIEGAHGEEHSTPRLEMTRDAPRSRFGANMRLEEIERARIPRLVMSSRFKGSESMTTLLDGSVAHALWALRALTEAPLDVSRTSSVGRNLYVSA